MPQNDSDLSTRLLLIKTDVTRHDGTQLGLDLNVSDSCRKRKERNLWQRRFWEHLIRDKTDFAQHCDYIHDNPVHHQLCQVPTEWQFLSVHRLITEEIYPPNWGDAQLSLGWMGDGSDGAFACRNALYKIRDRTEGDEILLPSKH